MYKHVYTWTHLRMKLLRAYLFKSTICPTIDWFPWHSLTYSFSFCFCFLLPSQLSVEILSISFLICIQWYLSNLTALLIAFVIWVYQLTINFWVSEINLILQMKKWHAFKYTYVCTYHYITHNNCFHRKFLGHLCIFYGN